MNDNSSKLFIKITSSNIYILTGIIDDQNNLKIQEKLILPSPGLNDNKILNIEKITDLVKKNILLIEQKINFTFKDLVIILDFFEISFLNLSGYKKLNGTQISKENISYILNELKASVDENEHKKKILHIFNSNYYLDKKQIENLPIGLFGDFYSHELSFNLINENDLKNLKNIFDKCNLKIKKILLNSFVTGSLLSDANSNINTFLHIKISKDNSKIFYVENDSIKFEQNFNFGTEIILKDISKITSLKIDTLKSILRKNPYMGQVSEIELIEKEDFKDQQYRPIKKKLISNIAEARIKELSDLMYFKNINFKKSLEKVEIIFLEITDKLNHECFEKIYENSFSYKNRFKVNFVEKPDIEKVLDKANEIVQFGWKKEAIPVTIKSKSTISRIFQAIFD